MKRAPIVLTAMLSTAVSATLVVGSLTYAVDAGPGHAPSARAKPLVGNNRANTIHGTPGEDEIYGRGGNDELFGEAGDDTIRGQSGQDFVFGGPGADVLEGGSKDTLRGDGGNDRLVLEGTSWAAHGDAGRDVIVFAGDNASTGGQVDGGSGRDRVVLHGSKSSHYTYTPKVILELRDRTKDVVTCTGHLDLIKVERDKQDVFRGCGRF